MAALSQLLLSLLLLGFMCKNSSSSSFRPHFDFETADSIVIEASNDFEQEAAEIHRSKKQLFYVAPIIPWHPVNLFKKYSPSPVQKTGVVQCVTNNGKEGRCASFEECYPLLLLRAELENSSSSVNLIEEIYDLSKHHSCSSVVYAGLSRFGDVCCELNYKEEEEIPEPYQGELSQFPHITQRPPLVNGTYGSPFYSTCGITKATPPKIVGGNKSYPGEFPWMVPVFGKNGKHTCGASLIDHQFVLTAAHCIDKYNKYDVARIRLHLGDHNIQTTQDVGHVTRKVTRVIKHKYFDIGTFVNDIALLKLDKPVDFTNHIQPICVVSGNNWDTEKPATVAGWGRLSERGQTSATLLKVEVPFWTNSECDQVYQGIAPKGILNSMVCAGANKKDSCIGDSGGPLMIKSGSMWQQVGIVSFGKGCGVYPGVYTRVDSFNTWINNNRRY